MRDNEGAGVQGVYYRYQAYLLRLWQETPDARWRASLQDAASGESTVFGSVPELVAFLQSTNARADSATDATVET